ncbi:MAG: hypothetical protein L0228_07705 [Planctomycetes bacterium]|nr:hypothetical protein [Planctomycetota bacterium]
MASLLCLLDVHCLLANRAGKFSSRHRVGSFSRELVPRFELLEDRTVLSTFTVLNLDDSGDGSLRAAIAAAEANPGADVINFAPAVQGTIGLTSGRLLITTDLSINGPGAQVLTVSGNHSSRVFSIRGGTDASTAITVDISGLTISDGRGEGFAGGVTNLGFSDVTLSGVVLSNNEHFGIVGVVQPAGGAIVSHRSGASVTLIDSLVTGNTVHGVTGPYVGAFGGGIATLNGARLMVANSTITSNQVISSPTGYALGGGIHFNVGSTVTVVNSTVADNEVVGGYAGSGGGISNSDGSLSITNSTISHNRVIGDLAAGGGIRTSRAGSVTTVVNSTITGNEALASDGYYGQAFGGGISNFLGGSLSISNSTLTDNRAVAGSSGIGIVYDTSIDAAFGGAIISGPGTLEISHSTLRGNQAIGGNNATHHAPNVADVGAAHGGAIFNNLGGEAIIRDSTIEHNRAVGGHGNTGSGPAGFVGTGTGGGIDNSLDLALIGGSGSPHLTVIDSIIRHNEAIGGDGNTATGEMLFVGAGLGGGIANYLGATSDITDSLLAHNRAGGGMGNSLSGGAGAANLGAGGAIFNALGRFQLDTGEVLADSIVNVERSILLSNQAKGGDGLAGSDGGDAWGGAIASLFNATTNANRTVFSTNRAIGGRGGAGAGGGNAFGGAIFNDDTSLLALARSLVTLNRAQGGSAGAGGDSGDGIGGGVYNLGDFDLDPLTLIRLNFASTSHNNIFGDFDFI